MIDAIDEIHISDEFLLCDDEEVEDRFDIEKIDEIDDDEVEVILELIVIV